MTATTATARGRELAASQMVDACTITAEAGGQVYDPGTDSYVTPAGAVRYSGKCWVKPRDNVDREVEAGAATVSLWPYVVSIPMSVTTVQDGDVVTITASAFDPSLTGSVMRVRQVTEGSFITARRLGCERQT